MFIVYYLLSFFVKLLCYLHDRPVPQTKLESGRGDDFDYIPSWYKELDPNEL